MTLLSDLSTIPGLTVRPQARMSEYTTFRIGGPAEILVETDKENSLLEVIEYCRKKGIPCISTKPPIRVLPRTLQLLPFRTASQIGELLTDEPIEQPLVLTRLRMDALGHDPCGYVL